MKREQFGDEERLRVGDILKGTAWTKKYPEIEFANYYRAGGIKKLDEKELGGSI